MDIKNLEQAIKDLARIAKEESISEIEVSSENVSLRINLGAPQVVSMPTHTHDAPSTPSDSTQQAPHPSTGGTLQQSPMIGTLYAAAEPGAAPFIKEGDTVQKGDTICIIEAMKLFNEIPAEHSGVISKIHFTDGQTVEHSSDLITIDTKSS